MCNTKIDELEDGMEDSDIRKWSRPSKVIFFALNFIIWLGSCALIALGIYAFVDTPFVRPLIGDTVLTTGGVVMVVVGSLGFVISFMGCCGALNNSKCLIMTYIIILIVLLAVLLVGGILGFMFTERAENAAIKVMRKTMAKYDSTDDKDFHTVAWNDIQRSLKCCGIMNYKDWSNYNNRFSGSNSEKVPASCCIVESGERPTSACLRTLNPDAIYESGCLDKTTELIQQHAPVIAIVGAIVAFCMVMAVLLAIVVYKRL